MPDDALLAAAAATGDGSLATDAGFGTQLDRVFADPRTRDTLWQFWNEWMRFESFTGFATDRPAFKALAAGENVGVAGHDHWGDMVREIQDLTNLYTWTQSGTLGDLMTSDLSVTKSADLAHLYGVPAWSGSGDYPRFTDGSRRGHPAARGAPRGQPGRDQPVPPGRVHPAIDPVRQPAPPRPEQPAAGLARSDRRPARR